MVATTWPGMIRELLAGVAALDGRVFRDGDDLEGVAFPYSTVLDPVALAPALRGDASTLGRFRDVQVDLWQTRDGYDEAVVNDTVAALDGSKAGGARLTVTLVVNVPEPVDVGQVHHSLTIRAGSPL